MFVYGVSSSVMNFQRCAEEKKLLKRERRSANPPRLRDTPETLARLAISINHGINTITRMILV